MGWSSLGSVDESIKFDHIIIFTAPCFPDGSYLCLAARMSSLLKPAIYIINLLRMFKVLVQCHVCAGFVMS